MNQNIGELICSIRKLEEDLEVEYRKKRENFDFFIKDRRLCFAEDVACLQRRFKAGLIMYVLDARMLNILSIPVIYSGFLLFLLLDLFIFVY